MANAPTLNQRVFHQQELELAGFDIDQVEKVSPELSGDSTRESRALSPHCQWLFVSSICTPGNCLLALRACLNLASRVGLLTPSVRAYGYGGECVFACGW